MAITNRVPIHSLGISQIISFGLLFYVFAQLKIPLAASLGVTETDVLYAISGSMFLQAVMAPKIGAWIDRFGALYVMWRGLVLGAFGMAMLPLVDHIFWLWCCMVPIGIGFAMSFYETAFSAAVQMDEPNARKNISYITFYGGVASSITWLTIAPLLGLHGLGATCGVIAAVLVGMAARVRYLDRLYQSDRSATSYTPPEFNWGILNQNEKKAIVALATSATLEYLVFASTTLLWINWFSIQFNDMGLAVILASIYGPFQVVGRVLEMRYGHHIDGRITGSAAFICIPLALTLAQSSSVPMVVVAMAVFGIGHGILTVTFGYVTNMFFRADVYGRAKGLIVMPRGVGNAIGPSVGGILFMTGHQAFFAVMIGLSICSMISFLTLLKLKTRDQLPNA